MHSEERLTTIIKAKKETLFGFYEIIKKKKDLSPESNGIYFRTGIKSMRLRF
jgi:hypothetical protein